MITTQEKRLSSRYQVIPQLVDIKEFSDESINLLINISLDGLQIQSSEDVEYHEHLLTSISVCLKAGDKPITLRSHCIWQQPLEEKGYYTIGCQFLDLSDELEESVNHVIDYYKM
ncbi:MAG TPA: PilZ domain-containing protein [Spirochaetes bacterium]|nr:PilZ domain-containing protein [Spirochaetota bacterium]